MRQQKAERTNHQGLKFLQIKSLTKFGSDKDSIVTEVRVRAHANIAVLSFLYSLWRHQNALYSQLTAVYFSRMWTEWKHSPGNKGSTRVPPMVGQWLTRRWHHPSSLWQWSLAQLRHAQAKQQAVAFWNVCNLVGDFWGFCEYALKRPPVFIIQKEKLHLSLLYVKQQAVLTKYLQSCSVYNNKSEVRVLCLSSSILHKFILHPKVAKVHTCFTQEQLQIRV